MCVGGGLRGQSGISIARYRGAEEPVYGLTWHTGRGSAAYIVRHFSSDLLQLVFPGTFCQVALNRGEQLPSRQRRFKDKRF